MTSNANSFVYITVLFTTANFIKTVFLLNTYFSNSFIVEPLFFIL